MRKTLPILAAAVLSGLSVSEASAQAGGGGGGRGGGGPQQPMGFFVSSTPIGDGANLGGLEGADRHCQQLAAAANPAAGQRTWRAYLSQTGVPAQGGVAAIPTVNARDRIGYGPWHNARGQLIANNIADLHGDVERDRNNIRKPTALNEKNEEVNGVGNTPNQHDILTGSDSRGMALAGDPRFTTCNNWTSNAAGAAGGRAMVGHHDRLGGQNTSWNAAHLSNGCSQENLRGSGGEGFLYCFAASPLPAQQPGMRED
jgi:hypothetical protein